MTSRYDPSGVEAEFEPGSRGRVLRNKLGIVRVREMQQAESEALLAVEGWLLSHYSADHRFTAEDVRAIHRAWLGEIYPWAGEYRGVNMAKEGFMFAPALQIPRLMAEYDRQELRAHTPCADMSTERLIEALARTHGELVIYSSVSGGKWSLRTFAGVADGFAGGFASVGFFILGGAWQTRLCGGYPCGTGWRLFAHAGQVCRGYPPDFAPLRDFEVISGAVLVTAKGLWMPSTAEDVAAETRNAAARVCGSRKYGLVLRSAAPIRISACIYA